MPKAARASSLGIGANFEVSTPWGRTPNLLG